MGRHDCHLLDGARPPGRCCPRTGGASCSQPPGRRVSGSKSGGAVSSGLFFVNVYMSTYIYIILVAMLGLPCSTGFSLVAENGRFSLVAGRGLLTAVASLVVRRLQGVWAQ